MGTKFTFMICYDMFSCNKGYKPELHISSLLMELVLLYVKNIPNREVDC